MQNSLFVRNLITFLISVSFFYGCVTQEKAAKDAAAKVGTIDNSQNKKAVYANASFYGSGDGFHGKKTASGEKFNSNDYTAAHRTYPFGTVLKVTNPDNNQSVNVRVNDRGPWKKGRDIDLSYAAAKRLGFIDEGVKKVKIEVVNES